MLTKKNLSCYIIGTENLCLECAKILQEHHFHILKIISQDERIIQWAHINQIPVCNTIDAFLSSTNIGKCDYFFSIVNAEILKTNVLKLPHYYAINYHNALLPRYAGVHATSWAIINGEKEHGITWHVVDDGIDTGDILKQAKVKIDNDETAFSLNIKCNEAAIKSFEQLIYELSTDTVKCSKQNKQNRSYFGYHQKPKNSGLITWSETSKNLECLVRASNFGEYRNKFVVLKLIVNNEYVIANELHKVDNKSQKKAGTVIKATDKGVQVATITQDILITKILRPDGSEYSIREFIKKYKISPDYCFCNMHIIGNEIDKTIHQVSRSEQFWVNVLNNFTPTLFPYALTNIKTGKKTVCYNICKIPSNIRDKISKICNSKTKNHFEIIFTIFIVYIFRITQDKNISVGLKCPNLTNNNLEIFFSAVVPFSISLDGMEQFKDLVSNVIDCFNIVNKNGCFLKDIFYRYPRLKKFESQDRGFSPSIQFDFVDQFKKHNDINSTLLVEISTLKWEYRICLKQDCNKYTELEFLSSKIEQHINILLSNICFSPSQPIFKLPILTSEEKLLISKINNTKKRYAADKTIVELFLLQVKRNPNKIAIIEDEEQITYQDLENLSNIFANNLLKTNINIQDSVAICMDRSIDATIATLAILKVRGIYVPIDLSYPIIRIKHIVNNCKIKLCIVNNDVNYIKLNKLSRIKIINFNYKEHKSTSCNLVKSRQYKIDDIVYIMYTSGSTGKPKGIEISHRGISRLVIKPNYVRINKTDCLAHLSNTAFDASTFEIWGALLNGAVLKVIKKDDVLNIDRLSDVLHQCTITFLTSALFNQIATISPCAFNNLRYLIVGGERVDPNIVRKVLERKANKGLNQLKIVNGYGPTENTTFSICYNINKLDEKAQSVLIGKPITDTQAYILDEFKQLLPVGVLGKLYLSGDALSKGYVGSKALTRKSFINNTKNRDIPDRLYETGDIARLLPSGNFDIVGRDDDQIKIRGFRIELKEIENVIQRHSMASENIVLFIGPNKRKKQLIAFIVSTIKAIKASDLKQFVSDYLPDYMVPSKFIILDKFPLTSNGKINKKVLNAVASIACRKPETPKDHKSRLLARIWEKVLGHTSIGIKDNFFELGGESIIALQIIAEARTVGIIIKPRDLFKYPTIDQLSRIVQFTSSETVEKKNIKSHKYLNLTPIQKWFFECNYENYSQFNHEVLLKCKKPLNIGIMKKSLLLLTQHHDVLRSSFKRRNGRLCGFIHKNNKEIPFHIEKIPHGIGDVEKRIKNYLNKNSIRFDISKQPMIRIIYLDCESKPKACSYLLIAAHHLIVDGVCWRILLEDLEYAYNTLISKGKLCLPKKTNSFHEWSSQLTQYAKRITASERAYWIDVCSNNNKIPCDFNKGDNIECAAKSINNALDRTHTKQLLYKNKGNIFLNVFELMISSLLLSVCDVLKLYKISLDIESHGREYIFEKIDVSRTVGWFTTIFPVNLDISNIKNPNISLQKVLLTVKQQLRNVPQKGIGYGVLRYLDDAFKGNEVLCKQANAPDIVFNYLGNFDNLLTKNALFQFSNEPITWTTNNNYCRKHLIEVTCWVVSNQLAIKWHYSKNHYKDETIILLSKYFIEYLKKMSRINKINKEEFFIPKDFPLTHIDKNQLRYIIKNSNNIEDIVPLNSLQEGLLYHAILEKNSEIYFTQIHWIYKKPLNIKNYKSSWQQVIERHLSLRSSFIWKNLKAPLQIIHNKSSLKLKHLDWSTEPEENKEMLFNQVLKKDRQKKFNLNKIPLMRIIVIKQNECEYRVIWSHHHIILDGWSVSNILTELHTIYQGLQKNKGYKLPYLPSYKDYLAWTKSQDAHKAAQFWLSYLKSYEPPKFPTIIRKIKEKCHSKKNEKIFTKKECKISQDESNKLLKFAKRNKLTLNTVLQGAWAILLSRYAQTDDVIFDITLSTRTAGLENINNLSGLLINTLPFRLVIKKNSIVKDIFKEIGEDMLSIAQYNYLPLADIQTMCKIKRDSVWSNNLFVFENYPINIQHIDENISEFTIHDFTHYPLVFVIFPGEQITLKMVCKNDAIDDDIASNLLESFCNILRNIILFPNKKIEQIEMLSKNKKNYWLGKNSVKTMHNPSKTVVQLFEEQAKKHPNQVALIYNEKILTYKELNQKTNQLAHYLQKQGVTSNSLVALLVDRDLHMVVGIMGILKAGGAYIPIDINCPKERLLFILEDSCSPVVVTKHNVLSKTINAKTVNKFSKVIYLDKHYDSISKESIENLNTVNSLSDIMYVIYTSGSTGKPKGVLVTHSNVARLFIATYKWFKFNSSDVWTLFHSYAFDFSVWEIWGALSYGGKLVIVPYFITRSPEDFYNLLIDNHVTILNQTPTAFTHLIEHEKNLPENKNLFLRFVIFGGEALDYRSLIPWTKKHSLKDIRLVNMYGITETTVHATYHVVSENDLECTDYASIIGRPIPDLVFYVLDNHLHIVPRGLIGELYICGAGVTKGYLNNPELTKQRFINNPFNKKSTESLYKTGDLARVMPTGKVEYCGRIDNQVKIRGFRIELGEIQSKILSYKNVKDTVILMHNNLANNKVLYAYIVAKNKKSFDRENLKKYLAKFLPDYMIPTYFILIDEIPFNVNGKIDTKSLHDFGCTYLNKESKNKTIFLNPLEGILTKIWKEILGLKEIGNNISFFDLGGHSILVLKLLSEIYRHFAVKLDIRTIYNTSTITGLSKKISIIKQKSKLDIIKEISIKTPVILIKRGIEKHSIFLIHPVGGTIFWFNSLAKYFPEFYSIYGIQDPGIETGQILFASFEEMASFYINEIKKIQPHGPYFLGGASFGANLSVEMARQLEAIGEKVAFVALLDGWARVPKELSKRKFLENNMARQHKEMRDKLNLIDSSMFKPIIDLHWHRAKLLDNYNLNPVEFRLTLFKAQTTILALQEVESHDNHWGNYSKDIEVLTVPGDHESMFYEPNVQELAKQLSEQITNSLEILL